MDTTYGPSASALSGLTRGIREYSLFQAVLLSANPDTENVLAADVGGEQGLASGEGQGFKPLGGVLFAAAIRCWRCR